MNKTHYTREELRKIVRLEDLGTDIWEPAEYDQVTCDGIYNITLEDLRTAINKIVEKKLPLNDVMNWCMCLDSNLSAWIGPLEVEKQQGENQFADVALRIGSMRLHGTGTQQNVRGGIGVLLAAEYAIQKRMKEHDFYGDNVVAANIRRCLAEAKELLPPKKNTGRYKDESFWSVKRLLKDDYKIRWKARQLKNGDWSVTFRRIAKRNEAEPRKLFFVISNLYFCTFTDTVKGHVKPLAGEMPAEGKADFLDTVYENDEPVTVFYYDDKPVLKLKGNDFDWRIPKPKKASGRTVRLVGITFTPGGRQYDYLCDIEDIKIGDRVIVNGYEGETEVIVQNISEVPEEELALPQEKYKKIIRKIYSISF